MHEKFGKDRACGSGDILADIYTVTQTNTQTCSSQYFATSPAGELITTVVVICLQANELLHTLRTVVRATQLIQFIKAHLNVTETKAIIDQLDKLQHNKDDQHDVGLSPLICDIHDLIPNHQYCPSDLSTNEYIRLCTNEVHRDREKYHLAHSMVRSMRLILLRSMRRARRRVKTLRTAIRHPES